MLVYLYSLGRTGISGPQLGGTPLSPLLVHAIQKTHKQTHAAERCETERIMGATHAFGILYLPVSDYKILGPGTIQKRKKPSRKEGLF